MDVKENLKRAALSLREADALLVTAGAGMGVDSGLPDFRGNEGFWKAYPPLAKLGVSFVEMANPFWFDRDPALAWGFYGHRLNLYRRTVPHAGFRRLLEVGQKKREGYFVFTSNVDGQFQIAGFDEDRIEECHGSIHHLQCSRPCSQDIWRPGRQPSTSTRRSSGPVNPFPGAPNAGPLPGQCPHVQRLGLDPSPHPGPGRAPPPMDRGALPQRRSSRRGGTGRRQGRSNRSDDLRGRRPGGKGHPDPDQSPRFTTSPQATLPFPSVPQRESAKSSKAPAPDPFPLTPPSLHLNSPMNGCNDGL